VPESAKKIKIKSYFLFRQISDTQTSSKLTVMAFLNEGISSSVRSTNVRVGAEFDSVSCLECIAISSL
jgi:hypothetical protein